MHVGNDRRSQCPSDVPEDERQQCKGDCIAPPQAQEVRANADHTHLLTSTFPNMDSAFPNPVHSSIPAYILTSSALFSAD